jgi:hypothetical protein
MPEKLSDLVCFRLIPASCSFGTCGCVVLRKEYVEAQTDRRESRSKAEADAQV